MQRSVNNAQFDFLDRDIPPITVDLDDAGRLREPRRTAAAALAPALGDSRFCEVEIDRELGTVWVWLKPDSPVKFSPDLLTDLRGLQEHIGGRLRADRSRPAQDHLRYQVFGSRIPGIFSLGGDLNLFRDCIRRRDARTLRGYARDAVDLVHHNATAHGTGVTTISLVQGQAMGGGLEAALAADVLVAERSARMGLPEILFNMFPGMGAYQLLGRRLSPREAERMILSGRTYTAEELHAMGVVDVVAEDGEGEAAVRRYIQSHRRQAHGRQGFARALQAATPLDKQELYRMSEVWVETALGLGTRDLETIDYLLRAQRRMAARAELEATPARMLMEA